MSLNFQFDFFKQFKSTRFIYLLYFYFICIFENLCIRLVLLFKEMGWLSAPVSDGLKIIFTGLYSDTLNFGYLAVPIVLYLIFIPDGFYKSKFQKYLTYVFSFFVILILSFQAHSEWFFWNEFNSRFNFIAVDYLVYTKEVLGNIQESYPMRWVYASIGLSSLVIFFLFFKGLKNAVNQVESMSLNRRLKWGSLFLVFPLFSFFVLENYLRHISENKLVNELSYNGLYQLFHAYRHNELDYDSFYSRLDESTMWAYINKNLARPSEDSQSGAEFPPIKTVKRFIQGDGPEKKLNVMYVVVESLAASFMKEFGHDQNVTPHLDELISKSIFFSNIYASGNRTIRGMEALTLSVPPTPGYSIVKRPNNEKLFSIGKVFFDKGYETKFIYGGYGYFDNMNYFFSNNYFSVVDRQDFKEDEFIEANIWGVDDESLFTKALKEADKSYQMNKPFFSFVMTTSNHRPYTYPNGRIDIPSHTSREGAVKYTDYAIHKFLKDAESKPWFNKTIFVVVADHGVGGRGTTELPMNLHHIPFFIYAPQILKPQRIDRLASQIDVPPTLISLLNFSYESQFYGQNIFKMTEKDERAFVGTYSTLGYYSKGQLVSLGVNKSVAVNNYNIKTRQVGPPSQEKNQDLINEAMSYYQSASWLWKNGKLKASE